MRAAALAAALLLSLARCARCSGLGEAWRVAELARFAGGEAAAGARALYAAGAAALRHGDARQAAALLARAAEAGACCEPQYVLLTALRDECGGGARAAAARALAGALDTLNNNPTRGELGARAAAQARYGLAHHNRAEGELDAAWAHVLAGARDVYTADAQRTAEQLQSETTALSALPAAFPASAVRRLGERLAPPRSAGAASSRARPLFIVGLPRGGSTLLERALGRHPAIHAAGEGPVAGAPGAALESALLALLNAALSRVSARGEGEAAVLAAVDSLDVASLQASAEAYAAALAALAPPNTQTAYVVDKTLNNFFVAPLLAALLPDAKFLIAWRDPRDAALSMFWQLFSGERAQLYTYDLAALGEYSALATLALRHLTLVLPQSRLRVAAYEETVRDLEGAMRASLSFLDLAWDDRTLSFAEAAGQVDTASIAQVRKPLYNSSVGEWRRHEQYLRPLLEALDAHSAVYAI